PDEGRRGMVGEGGAKDAGENGPRPAKARREHEREELGAIAHLRDGNGREADQKGLHRAAAFSRAPAGSAMRSERTAVCYHRLRDCGLDAQVLDSMSSARAS